MRAVVTAPFHDPVTGKMLDRATVLGDDDLTWLSDHPDLKHNLAFSDHEPAQRHYTFATLTPDEEK